MKLDLAALLLVPVQFQANTTPEMVGYQTCAPPSRVRMQREGRVMMAFIVTVIIVRHMLVLQRILAGIYQVREHVTKQNVPGFRVVRGLLDQTHQVRVVLLFYYSAQINQSVC